MINYFFNHFFHKRVRILIIIILSLVTLITFFMANPFTSEAELYLQSKEFNIEYYNRMLLIIKYVLLFLISLVIIDHDAKFIRPLIAYFKRGKIATIKLIFYYILIFWLIISIYAILIVVPALVAPYFQFNLKYFIEFIKIIPDYFLLTTILLILTRENTKALSFLILILFIVYSFILEDIDSIILSYILPLSSGKMLNTTFGIIYLVVYFVFLIYLYYVVFLNENI